MIHQNDKQNQRKHRKMWRRVEDPKKSVSPQCKWAKKNVPQLLPE